MKVRESWFRYSPSHIKTILNSYVEVHNSCFEHTDSGSVNVKSNTYKANFENSIINKADIDKAIDKLGLPHRWLNYCRDIEEPPAGRGLSQSQYTIAQYIQGNIDNISSLTKELARIA